MKDFDGLPISDIPRFIATRLDGKAFILIAVLAISVGLGGFIFDLSLGRYHGRRLLYSILGLLPVFFVYYLSLIYFSTHGRASEVKNAVFLALVPIFFVIYS
jgi:hypothetical protein